MFCLAFSVNAQGVFRADCNAKDVVVGNPFKVSFVLEDADIRNISFPNFDKDGFNVLQGPVNESRYVSINGKGTYSEAYIFILAPKKTGKLTLGSARVVTTKNKALTTKPITINSVQESGSTVTDENIHNLPPALAGNVFFRMESNTLNAVPGEEIRIDLKLYTRTDLARIDLTKEPSCDDANISPLPYYDREIRMDVFNGKQFASKIIYSFSLFTGKTGEIVIKPAAIKIAMARY